MKITPAGFNPPPTPTRNKKMKTYTLKMTSKIYGPREHFFASKKSALDFLRHCTQTQPGIFTDASIEESSTAIQQAAAAMGRKGGASKSKAKADAAKANGQKGGRPRKHATSNPRQTAVEPPRNP